MQSLIYQTFQSGGGSITWDAIEDAVADLTLNNANFSTTFAQTSDVPWTWENTTPATSSGLSTVALVASGTITGASATPTLNTVGADAIVVVIANSNNPPPPGLAFTDSEGNAWTYQTSANFPYLAVAYCLARRQRRRTRLAQPSYPQSASFTHSQASFKTLRPSTV